MKQVIRELTHDYWIYAFVLLWLIYPARIAPVSPYMTGAIFGREILTSAFVRRRMLTI